MMRQLAWAIAVLLALVAPDRLWARSVTVRSGEHADFSRVVVAGVDENWTWQDTAGGGSLHAPGDVTFDLSKVFDLIPRTRLTDAKAEGAVLSLTAAEGVSITAERQGDVFVIDLSGQPGPGAADPAPPAGDAAPVLGAPMDAATRELGAITTLPGVGQTPQAASPQAQSIEQALLFRIAQAAGEGSLTVADRATLDALRRAGLIPPAASPPAEAAAEASPPAADAPLAVTCDDARLALTFPTDAPKSVQGYEQAYLAMDRRDNDPGLVDLARGYLSLALPDEALAILSLRADPALARARVLAAAAEALDQRPPSDPGADLATLAECGPEVELWLLSRPGAPPRRSEGYALFQALLALPDPLRQTMMTRLRQTLPSFQDSASKTLLELMAGLDPACAGPCLAADAPLGAAVLSLSQLDRSSLTQQAQAVFLRLLNSSAPLAIETARHLDAMSFERRSEPGGALMRASALIAYARAGDFDTALTKLAALTPDYRHDPALTQAATAVATALAEASTDAEFLRLAFAHAPTLAICCDPARPAFEARLASHGFGPGGAQAAPSTGATPTPAPPPVDAAKIGAAKVAAAPENHVQAADGAPSAQSATAAPAAASLASPAGPGATASASPSSPPASAPPQAAKAITGSLPTENPALPAASDATASASAAPDAAPPLGNATAQDSALVAKSRDLTGASAALRSQVADSLAQVGLTVPQP